MKISDQTNYKAGPKDECGTPPYAIMPIKDALYDYSRLLYNQPMTLWEPAIGPSGMHLGIVNGLKSLGFNVLATNNDFTKRPPKCFQANFDVIITNPPFSVKAKRDFISTCLDYYFEHRIPFCLLMKINTISEKYNGARLISTGKLSVHIPNGRINFSMPNKGYGTQDNPTKATFDTAWFCIGLTDPGIYRDTFNMSNHFKALQKFEDFCSE